MVSVCPDHRGAFGLARSQVVFCQSGGREVLIAFFFAVVHHRVEGRCVVHEGGLELFDAFPNSLKLYVLRVPLCKAYEACSERDHLFVLGDSLEVYVGLRTMEFIFLDYSMPVMDGPTFAKRIRSYIDEQSCEINQSLNSSHERYRVLF